MYRKKGKGGVLILGRETRLQNDDDTGGDNELRITRKVSETSADIGDAVQFQCVLTRKLKGEKDRMTGNL